MNIKTKYEIGQHIWVVYTQKDVVVVFDDYIGWITVDDDGLKYGLKESCDDIKEEDVILYNEPIRLSEKVKQLMQEIREKEGRKDE